VVVYSGEANQRKDKYIKFFVWCLGSTIFLGNKEWVFQWINYESTGQWWVWLIQLSVPKVPKRMERLGPKDEQVESSRKTGHCVGYPDCSLIIPFHSEIHTMPCFPPEDRIPQAVLWLPVSLINRKQWQKIGRWEEGDRTDSSPSLTRSVSVRQHVFHNSRLHQAVVPWSCRLTASCYC
jgi:hypothetical protein